MRRYLYGHKMIWVRAHALLEGPAAAQLSAGYVLSQSSSFEALWLRSCRVKSFDKNAGQIEAESLKAGLRVTKLEQHPVCLLGAATKVQNLLWEP